VLTEKDVQRIREELKLMDDGSTEFDELYATYSWFAQKFIDFSKKVKKPSTMAKL